jgi:hypothetical protein
MRHVRAPEQIVPWKEVLSVEIIYTADVAVAPLGAACLGVRSPWADLPAAGAKHALAPIAVLSVSSTDAHRAAFRPAMAPLTQSALMAAELLPTVNEARTQKNVQKTRIDAGGYGAMGPYPEREQPA